MKVAVLIPHRNDRPAFLANLKRMLQAQTLQPDIIHFEDYEPLSSERDITQRYRLAYAKLCNQQIDVIALMEVDDWYHPEYLERMVMAWDERGRPDIFGIGYSVYYHLGLQKWFSFEHENRSSAMSTLLKPDLTLQWPTDADPYTDTCLWKQLREQGKAKTWFPGKHLCINMKHGTGLTGGSFHSDRLHRFTNANGKEFLQMNLDKESFDFYSRHAELVSAS